jgi:hypothetical protein
MYVNRKSESAMLLEIEHLKDDNIRLLQMLKTTEEVKKIFLILFYFIYLFQIFSLKILLI